MNLFCYTGQRTAVMNWMTQVGLQPSPRTPRAVDRQSVDRLQGIEDIQFVVFPNHIDTVPDEVWTMLRIRGATIIRVDDHFARERHYTMQQAQRMGRK
jgi:hypothetical protein